MNRSVPHACVLFALACGPGVSPVSDDADGSGGSTTGEMETSVRSTSDASVSDTGMEEDESSSSSSSDGSESGEPVECAPEGAYDVDMPAFELSPADDENPVASITGTSVCTVTEAIEDDEDPYVRMQLSCETEGGPTLLELVVEADTPLVDTSWLGRELTLSADAGWGFFFGGWWVLRDEAGELLLAEGTIDPPPEASAPFAISFISLGEACPSDFDALCYSVFEHRLRFTSNEGTFDCYDGLGYETADYVFRGSAQWWERTEPPLECMKGDAPTGLDQSFTIARRP
jgi:hypothetical protein